MILQDKVLGVGPVIRQVSPVVIPHNIRRIVAHVTNRMVLHPAGLPVGAKRADEPVHLPLVHILAIG